jgi:hypothetical protein
MIRDPLYQQIVKALTQPLNTNLFEHCAVDLLRPLYPTLVLLPGGSDFGIDGTGVDLDGTQILLICTTGQSVIANLTKNLSRCIESGVTSGKVVVATSQPLTATRIRNLRTKATELGFQPINVHHQTDFADRLYRDPA